jgi:hypothetical protein
MHNNPLMRNEKKIGVCIILAFVCCSELVVSAAPQAHAQSSPIQPTVSYVDAIGFLNGRMTNCTYGEDYIEFHAKHVFFLALAWYGCSVAWFYLNKDVHIDLYSLPIGIIGIQSLHVVFKTKVSGPI